MKRAFVFLSVAALVVACGGATTSDLINTDGESSDAGPGTFDAKGGGQGDGSGGGGDAQGGGGSDGSMPTVDSSPGKDSAVACFIPSGDAGGTCNGLVIQGTPILTTCHQSNLLPTAIGGTIRDGTYVLESLDYYGDAASCPTAQERIVWQICGGAWATVQEGATGLVYYAIDETQPTTTSVSLTVTCPANPTPVVEHYDATPNALTLYVNLGPNQVRADKFKRQ